MRKRLFLPSKSAWNNATLRQDAVQPIQVLRFNLESNLLHELGDIKLGREVRRRRG